MASSDAASPGKLLQNNEPKHSTKWTDCVFGQKKTGEKISNAQSRGIDTILATVQLRKNYIYTCLQHNLPELSDLRKMAVCYHRSATNHISAKVIYHHIQ